MGIQGLLPFLKKIHDPINIAKFAGCTVAIDAYCWLHKGAFSCAEKLVLGEKTDQYVYYCMKYLEYMLKNNLKPIMVFDGCHLPSKKDVEKNRREKRDMYRKKAAQLLREGNRAEARECLQRCIDISPEMALRLMEVCRERGIDCIVAPYEADAQLAFLNKAGIAQVIVTEDSDLLLFGCDRVIFKMDHFGNGMMIEKSRLNEVLEIQSGFYTFEKFRYMCILSGCDYLPSLSGIGLVKACKVFKLAGQTDLKVLLKKFPTTYLKMSLTVTDDYINGFIKANNTFLHQLVFDPLSRKLVPLNDYDDDIEPDDLTYAGSYMPHEKAYKIALGNINIYTMQKFADFDPATFVPSKVSKKKPESLHMLSIWDKNYRIRPKLHLTETQNRQNLQGKEVIIKSKIVKTESIIKPVEDCKEVKSDVELSGIYLHSPSKTQKSLKRRQDICSSDEELSPPKKYQKFIKSPRKPEFLDSLVEADNEESSKDDKENDIKSPRNRFAVLSPTKKPKFNLNAPKEVVKSRYFASSSSLSMKTEHKDTPVETSKDNSVVEQKPNSLETVNNLDMRTATKKEFPRHKSDPVKPSPKSAFSWSKFKSTKHTSNVESSPCSRNPFKRVVSDPNFTSYVQSASSISRTETQNSVDTFSQVSSHSNLYSIDSDCLPNMDDVDECCHGDSNIQDENDSSKTRLISSEKIDEKANTQDDEEEHDIIVVKSQPGTSSVDLNLKEKKVQKAPLKSGCRVSGLSRGKKKSSTIDIKQQNLKDMFSKFSNDKKKTLLKLKHEKDNDLSATPTTDNTILSVKGGIQRCLLP